METKETKNISVTLHARVSKKGTPYLMIQIGVLSKACGSSLTITVNEEQITNIILPSINSAIIDWLREPINKKPSNSEEEE